MGFQPTTFCMATRDSSLSFGSVRSPDRFVEIVMISCSGLVHMDLLDQLLM